MEKKIGGVFEKITVFVSDIVNNINLTFKIKKYYRLKCLMDSYCKRTGLVRSTLRFEYKGNIISEADTPLSLEIEENDTINIFTSPPVEITNEIAGPII